MSDQLIVERDGLSNKDKGELQAIVSALGGTSSARMRKADLIDKIMELSGASGHDAGAEADDHETDDHDTDDHDADNQDDGADSDSEPGDGNESDDEDSADHNDGAGSSGGHTSGTDSDDRHPVGSDGEPLADWEIKVLAEGGKLEGGRGQRRSRQGQGQNQGRGRGNNDQQKQKNSGRNNNASGSNSSSNNPNNNPNNNPDDDDPNNRRSRRRGRGRGRDREDVGNAPVSVEPIEVEGFLDLRDEGYAFLRVEGCLPSRHDAYVSVKQVRQFGLRKGDQISGLSRPANRNEKNPALQQLVTINGKAPEQARDRARFDSLTPVFPSEQLVLESKDEPLNMTTRIIDLLAPIGKGQRGLIVSPPDAGKTTTIKAIASAIEANNPEVALAVLLIDERPEEVTDMTRHISSGEVVSSTFDRPPEEHIAVAELTLERAKRMAEDGEDVVLLVDGITRLARAYNYSAQQNGRVLSGGVDAGALYPPKRFLGAARNLEEGGSLTILATALVETGSTMDELILDELRDTANMVLRLDRRLADKGIFPAISFEISSTRNEEELRDSKEITATEKLRKVLAERVIETGNSEAGIEMLLERMAKAKTNAAYLAEIGKLKA